MEQDLALLRGKLDETDRQIIALFKERMDTVSQIVELKREQGLPVLDAGREREILERTAALAGQDLRPYAGLVFRTLLSVSRAYQTAKRASSAVLPKPCSAEPEPVIETNAPASAACPEKWLADQAPALARMLPGAELIPMKTPDDAANAVAAGECGFCVLPLADDGWETYELIGRLGLSIVRAAGCPFGKTGESARFLCAARKPIPFEEADTVILMFDTGLEPDGLYNVLGPVTAAGAELLGVSGRPLPESSRLRWLMGLKGSFRDEKTRLLIAQTRAETERFILLGFCEVL